MSPSKPLDGKVVLITGGAKRLGRAFALNLGQAGADVVITFLRSVKEAKQTTKDLEKSGVGALAVRCDVTRPENVRAAVREVVRKFGGLDILINNAGNYETLAFDELTLPRWDAMFATNVRGPFLVSKEALKHLRERNGKIIHLGSLGRLSPWSSHAHYCSSKAALHMLTEVMAKALAPEIAVNCVAPGMIDLGEGEGDAEFFSRMSRQTPMQRNGTQEDIVSAVMYFASSPLFITGQILTVDGGLALR